MADNILKGIIKIEAPGVTQTANQVSTAATRMEQSIKKIAPAVNSANLALINTGRVIQDLPFGFLGVANNLNPLLESFQRVKAETGSTSAAFKSMGASLFGAGGLGFALSLASSAMILFGDRLFKAKKSTDDAKKSADDYKNSIDGIFKSVAKEAAEVSALVALLKNETETRERKLGAIQKLIDIQPEVFKGLKLEGEAVVGLDNAYKNYLDNLKNVIAAKIKQTQLEAAIEKILRLQGVTLTSNEKQFQKSLENIQNFLSGQKGSIQGQTPLADRFRKEREASTKEIQTLENEIQKLLKDITQLSAGIKVPEVRVKSNKIKIDLSDSDIVDITLPPVNLVSAGTTGGLFNNVDASKSIKGIAAGGREVEKTIQDIQRGWLQMANSITSVVTPAIQGMFEAIVQGKNAWRAFGDAVAQIIRNLIAKMIEAAILAAALSLISGGSAKGGVGFFKAFGSLLGGGNGFGSAVGGFSGGQTQIVVRQRGFDMVGTLAHNNRLMNSLF